MVFVAMNGGRQFKKYWVPSCKPESMARASSMGLIALASMPPTGDFSFLLEDMEAANKRTDRPGPCVGDVFAFAVF